MNIPGRHNCPPPFGFTLMEILLVVALIGLLFGIATPMYISYQFRNDLDVSAITIAQTLRRAQLLSQAVDGDNNWGVRIQINNIILFRGPSYAGRNTGFDELFDLYSSITPSGLQEIVFAKMTGLPQTTGTVILTSSNNETRPITINSKGMVSY